MAVFDFFLKAFALSSFLGDEFRWKVNLVRFPVLKLVIVTNYAVVAKLT